MSGNISNVVIRRMPRYYRYLSDLLDNGVERISSNELSKIMNVTASQIRQDLNNFGGFGQQGYGYNVEYLHQEIGKILGIDRKHHMIIIGAGHLGQAIANFVNFEKRGFILSGIFDVNPELEGTVIRGVKVRMMDELEEFLQNNPGDIVVFTMPKDKASDIAQKVVSLGIKAIWNFANMELDLPDDVTVENVHLSDSLMQLSYNIEKHRTEEK
jgi:redox-sensing transcriptional repressor